MPTAAGARTLSLYRQILRIGRSWAGPREVSGTLPWLTSIVHGRLRCVQTVVQEQKYIYSEARKQFRAHQHTTQPAELDKQVQVTRHVTVIKG